MIRLFFRVYGRDYIVTLADDLSVHKIDPRPRSAAALDWLLAATSEALAWLQSPIAPVVRE